ncbi:MAG: rRNA pseudouridine synthase [Acinetobacter sp.]|jgi:16S rRNA pseudouridine516 synthase|nr:MAG: rRNA pseudouridine synthase [Acinetobacter sp.]
MQLDKLLQSQGFGSRKHCQYLIQSGHVKVDDKMIENEKAKFQPEHLNFSVFDESYLYREKVYIALNKPQGYECSHQPQQHHSVFELFPDHLRLRNIQTVGRLDQNTTGLLLLTDDGQFLHQLTHPRKHVAKYYRMTTYSDIVAEQIQQLQQGVSLKNEKGIFQAQDVLQLAQRELRFAIDQGVYHQVKRMLIAVGNEVQALHRDQIGQLTLDALQLEVGQWCYLSTDEIQLTKQHA